MSLPALGLVSALGVTILVAPAWSPVASADPGSTASPIWGDQAPTSDGQGWSEIKLLSSEISAGDHFGKDLAIDGNRMVVSSDDGFQPALALVFERFGGRWWEVAKLRASDGIGDDFFASQVAVSGDTIVVSAPGADNFAGVVYIFEQDHGGPGQWGEMAQIRSPDGEGDIFASISIHRDTLLVGSTGDDTKVPNAGALYVFERDAGGPDNWGWVDKLFASDAGQSDYFGAPNVIDGNTLVVAATEDDDVALNAGAAYVFDRDPDGSWVEVAKLIGPDGESEDEFGFELAISGDIVVAGVETRGSELGNNVGVAYVFERDHGGVDQWGESARLTASDAAHGDSFGVSAAAQSDRIVVGARFSDGIVENSGAVFIFERAPGSFGAWIEVAKLYASDGAEQTRFGETVAIDGSWVVVGASSDEEAGINAGAAYVFGLLPQLSVSGACPGVLVVEVLDATPTGPVVLVGAEAEGSSIVPSGPCSGKALDLEDPRVLSVARADTSGTLSNTRTVRAANCGLYLQALDLATCNASNSALIP